MSLREILLWPDARLSRKCRPVEKITPDIRQLAADMLETMYAAPGRGLAAPQVGELLRLFVMDTTWKEGAATPRVFINPQILQADGAQQVGSEGCLSLPGISTDIARHRRVLMRWTNLDGAQHEGALEGFDAVCAQHEMDHLDGVMTLDRLEGDERARVLRAYSGALA